MSKKKNAVKEAEVKKVVEKKAATKKEPEKKEVKVKSKEKTDTRQKDFPLGTKVKYIGKKTGFPGKGEVVAYVKAPQTGITVKISTGKKKTVTPGALKIV